ncbi:MAG: methylated-DNA--[protein]-cysteine S-methyltransferase, partial [Chloroflexota bacterium]|nr:methylated-DNA--[protein]-cysteine S-methyltransferase [Chloroflexota bacterium]
MSKQQPAYFMTLSSPWGELWLCATERGICYLAFGTTDVGFSFLARHGLEKPQAAARPWLTAAQAQLDAYFAGSEREFGLPLDLRGTSFQRAVWIALLQIPYGETRTYGEIATAVGRPSAARAVGQAVGTNPVSIIVPCHRVIGADGTLTGYGGGLERKRGLLQLEHAAFQGEMLF